MESDDPVLNLEGVIADLQSGAVDNVDTATLRRVQEQILQMQLEYAQLATALGTDVTMPHNRRVVIAEILARIKTGLIHSKPDETGAFFICGASDSVGVDGLPDQIQVGPRYGLNGFAVYSKTRDWIDGGGS